MTGDEIGAGGAVGGGQSSKQTLDPKRACEAARRPLIQHDAATIEHDAHVKVANRAETLTTGDGAPKHYMVGEVIRAACRASGLTREELTGPLRGHAFLSWRQAAFVVMREQRRSLPVIGRAFGRHHTTVLHGLNVAPRRWPDKIAAIRAAL